MAGHNLDRALSLTFKHEAGFVNHPRDPGGATNFGVTIKTLAAHRGHPVSIRDVKALTKGEARQILKEGYWDPIFGDELPSGLDYAVFDFAVNSGPSRAVKTLQECLGVAPDGIMGKKTLRAIQEHGDVEGLIDEYIEARLVYVKGLKTWKTFGRGWSRRITGVDPAGKLPKQLGVIGESKALRAGKKPLGIDPDSYAQGKARDEDRKATSTVRGRLAVTTVAGTVGSAATEVAANLAPAAEILETIQWICVGLTVVAAIAGAFAVINNMRETGTDA